MGEHKDRRVVRRVRPPPSLPGIVLPVAPNRPKHVAPQDPGADIFERLQSKIVVDALAAAAFAVHLLECLGSHEPLVQFETANAQRIVQILAGPGAKSVDRNGKRGDPDFAHDVLLSSILLILMCWTG